MTQTSLGQILELSALKFSFDQRLFEDLAAEIRNRAIRPNGSSMDADNVLVLLNKWDLHVGVFSPFFGQNLDAEIIVLVAGVSIVVPIDLVK